MSLLSDIISLIDDHGIYYQLSTIDRILLFTLVTKSAQDGTIAVLQKELIKTCTISKRSLLYSLGKLTAAKIITLTKVGRKNVYTFGDLKSLIGARFAPIGLRITPENEQNMPNLSNKSTENRCNPCTLSSEIGAIRAPIHKLSTGSFDLLCLDKRKKIKEKIYKKEKRKKKASQIHIPTSQDLVFPEWLVVQDWEDFVEHRRTMKAPMSVIAKRRALHLLTKLHGQGHNVSKIIDQSIVRGWRGLFPVRDNFQDSDNYIAEEAVFKALTSQDYSHPVVKACKNQLGAPWIRLAPEKELRYRLSRVYWQVVKEKLYLVKEEPKINCTDSAKMRSEPPKSHQIQIPASEVAVNPLELAVSLEIDFRQGIHCLPISLQQFFSPTSKNFDKKLYNMRKQYLKSLDEENARKLPKLDQYDRLKFMTESIL